MERAIVDRSYHTLSMHADFAGEAGPSTLRSVAARPPVQAAPDGGA